MSTWATLVSSLGAAIIGGLVAALVTQRRERLQARAEVRRWLTKVETWMYGPGNYREFVRGLAAVEASAILAGVPRAVVADYTTAAEQRRRSTRYEEDVGPNGESGWVISHGPVTEAHEAALKRCGRLPLAPVVGSAALVISAA